MGAADTAGAVDVRWITAFLDRPAATVAAAVDFWVRVTATALSPVRGERGQFATFLPADGEAYLKVQTVLHGMGGGHLDLHVDDPVAAAERAVRLGATAAPKDGYVSLGSPAGLAFCFVPDRTGGAPARPVPVRRPEGVSTLVDQVCVDVPPSGFDDEYRFWRELTGWREAPRGVRPEFRCLLPPAGLPLGILMQRLDDEPPGGRATCHLDLATTDRDAEVAVQEGWGARVVYRNESWTTLTDPSGTVHCVTGRRP
jgi:hypothetical protein